MLIGGNTYFSIFLENCPDLVIMDNMLFFHFVLIICTLAIMVNSYDFS